MSLRRPLTAVLAASALVGSGLLSGCGVSGTQFYPGEAARIDGDVITVGEVDEAAAGMCEVLTTDPRLEGQVFSGATIRNAAERGLVLRQIGVELLDEYDIETIPDDIDDGANAIRDNYRDADEGAIEAALPAFTGDQFLFGVLLLIGRDEVGEEASEEEAVAAGVQRAQAWQESADIEINPAFDAIEIGDEQVLTSRDDVSVAVSDFAVSAATDVDGGAADLPESQRCGR